MTQDAQSALRRGKLNAADILTSRHDRDGLVIEKYTSNTRFCLICNYVNKIIPALQSRCTRYAVHSRMRNESLIQSLMSRQSMFEGFDSLRCEPIR